MKKHFLILAFLAGTMFIQAENGYDLWLRYTPMEEGPYVNAFRKRFSEIVVAGDSPTLELVRDELRRALGGMLCLETEIHTRAREGAGLLVGLPGETGITLSRQLERGVEALPGEGYVIRYDAESDQVQVISGGEMGLLYGTFHLIRLLQTRSDLKGPDIVEVPKTGYRLLNHWDNLDRTVERGYAGFSIWDWHRLPDYIDPRYVDYARANASIGINGTVLTNVNANALVLTRPYLEKVKALADVFRPWGIRVYLTARFSAPMEIGGLKTADPLDGEVERWWKDKASEIYGLIPDFGGFLVKANSEGQPGPQDYERSHAEGANMLARAVGPHGGVVMWRAFVYSHEVPDDRAKQAYNEFMPLDGKFEPNVLVQVKNGPIDFQPREPFHPLFGAMEGTPLMMEFQITQEYLGCATHLVYLAPLFREVLDSDTYARGKGSTVARAVDGSLHHIELTGMAGVSNIGNDINWTGHPFAQANWYAYGRLAWDHGLGSGEIAEEWLRMTFSNNMEFLEIALPMMLGSREAAVNYMTPLGLHHQMAEGHHWGPGPWVDGIRPDWTSVYYHRADAAGLGFDRSSTGSGATAQYFPQVRDCFDSMESCPEEFLLWFHHVPWDHPMSSGRTLWEELVYRYYTGAETVKKMQEDWQKASPWVDAERFGRVSQLLAIQSRDALWWRNALVLYFRQFSGRPIPEGYEHPGHDLEYYKNLEFHYVPGI